MQDFIIRIYENSDNKILPLQYFIRHKEKLSILNMYIISCFVFSNFLSININNTSSNFRRTILLDKSMIKKNFIKKS